MVKTAGKNGFSQGIKNSEMIRYFRTLICMFTQCILIHKRYLNFCDDLE